MDATTLEQHVEPVNGLKRKCSDSDDVSIHATQGSEPPPSATPTRRQSSPHVNYLARQYDRDLPLVSSEDGLRFILDTLTLYHDVLDRHESLAANLGARTLAPMLIRRFERMFDGPPAAARRSSGDEESSGEGPLTWLDVVDFARSNPEQFFLSHGSDGTRVCQFYTKQHQVEISEDDYMLVTSGMPQKMIPPEPIAEDEEKELGTLNMVEIELKRICRYADQVAAQARQLRHRLRGRKQAIVERRLSDTAISGRSAPRVASPSNVAMMNGVPAPLLQPSSAGLASLNASQLESDDVRAADEISSFADSSLVHQATYNELMQSFSTVSDRKPPEFRYRPLSKPRATVSKGHSAPYVKTPPNSIAIPHTPASLICSSPFEHPDTEGGPFKPEIVRRLEGLARGERILPPCDRCRRLHMECQKNLTACVGCTRKHAKCAWKNVTEDELRGTAGWVEERPGALMAQAQSERERDGAHAANNYYAQATQRRFDGAEEIDDMPDCREAAHSIAATAVHRGYGGIGAAVANMGFDGAAAAGYAHGQLRFGGDVQVGRDHAVSVPTQVHAQMDPHARGAEHRIDDGMKNE